MAAAGGTPAPSPGALAAQQAYADTAAKVGAQAAAGGTGGKGGGTAAQHSALQSTARQMSTQNALQNTVKTLAQQSPARQAAHANSLRPTKAGMSINNHIGSPRYGMHFTSSRNGNGQTVHTYENGQTEVFGGRPGI